MYYLALGHYKMGNYEDAQRFNGTSSTVANVAGVSFISFSTPNLYPHHRTRSSAAGEGDSNVKLSHYTSEKYYLYFMLILLKSSHIDLQ